MKMMNGSQHDPQSIEIIKGSVRSYLELGCFSISPSVSFVVSMNDGAVSLDCDELDLHSVGYSLEEAEADMVSEIGYVWDHYVNGNQSNLSEDAKEYARMFSEFVSKV